MGLSLAKVAEALETPPTGPGANAIRAVHEISVTIGVLAMVLSTQANLEAAYGTLFAAVFWVFATVYAIEYCVRLAIAPWAHWAHRDEPWRARWHWAVNFHGLVDFAGTLPVVALICGAGMAHAQLFGALWLAKLVPYAPGLELVGRVLRNARKTMAGLFFGFLIVLLLAATLAYEFEGAAQPTTFGSIPLALWWAVSTLTTVGYGDEVPITVAGRFLAGIVMICGIGIFALWTAILVTGFGYEMRRREFLRTWDLVARVPYFQGLGAGTIADVAQLLRPSDFAAGTVVMRRGQPGDCMYFIVSGEITIQIKPHPVSMGPGEFFGELALITGEPRSATAVARTTCELLYLDLADFRQLTARHPDVAKLIEVEAMRRRRETLGMREATGV
jgi:voltage-gated potassium channel